MTGWRLGWLTAPPSIFDTLGLMVQYTKSNSPEFIQDAGVAAIEQCEDFVARFRDYCSAGRKVGQNILAGANRIRYSQPEAAFYAFLEVEGERDSMALARRLVREARVGVAPGMSFGEESEGWLRLCFAQDPELLRTGLERIADTDSHQLPRRVLFRDALPRTGSGKLAKRILREEATGRFTN